MLLSHWLQVAGMMLSHWLLVAGMMLSHWLLVAGMMLSHWLLEACMMLSHWLLVAEILRQACYGKNFILNLLRRAVQNDSAFAGGGAIDMELSK